MIIKVNVQVEPTLVKIEMPQAEMTTTISKVAMIDKPTGKIAGIGETSEEIAHKRDLSDGWEKETNFDFVNPFDLEKFGAKYVVSILKYYAKRGNEKIRGQFYYFMFLFDRFDYDLWLQEYEHLSKAKQVEFGYIFYKEVSTGKLSVNGQSVKLWPYKISDWTFRVFPVVLSLMSLPILRLLISTEINDFVDAIGIIVIGIGVFLIVWFLTIVVGILIVRNLLPYPAMKLSLLEADLPDIVKKWLVKTLLNEA